MANTFSWDSYCKAQYRFESGALTTDSNGTNTLSVEGSPTASATCKEGSYSVDYSGSSQCHYRQDAFLSTGFPTKNGDSIKKMSFCFWFRADTVPGSGNYDSFMSKWDYGGSKVSWLIRMDDSKIKFLWGYGTGTSVEYCTIYSSPTTGRWYHVGVALDGVSKSLYYKVWDDTAGAVVAENTWNPTNELRITDAQFVIGADYNSINHINYYDGKIDELVIFNRLLTEDEIDAIRSGTFGPPELQVQNLAQAQTVDNFTITAPPVDLLVQNLAQAQAIDTITIPGPPVGLGGLFFCHG